MLPSGSAVLYYMLNAQLFLLPLHLPRREHRNKVNKGNQNVTHIKGVIHKQHYI